ncbi:MAG TPA: DegV family protein [Pelolinea sp.]|nr:DegV family protein [Pelolinea sp.]
MKIAIVTYSTADLLQSEIKKHHIGVVPLYIKIGDMSHLEGIDMKHEPGPTGYLVFSG